LDTGPLVALLLAGDAYHRTCAEIWKTLELPLVTCWPVLTEAAWLLRSRLDVVEHLMDTTASGLFRILPLTEADGPGIGAILKRYRALRPQLADAALVHLARRERIGTIFTFDQRDFRVYRGAGNRAFRLLPG
jgi:predicted nucleic acid-binding protein